MRKNLFRLALALCLACPVLVQADPVFPSSTSGNKTTYSEGTYSNATYAGAAVATSAAGYFAVNYASEIRTAAGVAIPVIASAIPGAGAVAAAVRFCLSRPACYGAGIAASVAIAAKESGFDVTPDPSSGLPVIKQQDPSICTSAPCYAYNGNAYGFGGSYPSLMAACRSFAGLPESIHAATAGGKIVGIAGTYGDGQCIYNLEDGRQTYPRIAERTQVPPAASNEKVVNLEDLIRGIEFPSADSTVPAVGASPKWAETVKKAAETGATVPLTAPTSITVPKPTVTSAPTHTDLGGGKTKTVTKSTTVTCTPPDCVAIETTVEQIKDLGVGTTTTTTTDAPADVVQDVPLSNVPTLYKRKYENGIVGVWTDKKAQLSSSGLGSLLGAMMPTVGASGGCPVFTIPAKIGPLSFGSGFSGPPCYIWEFCKVVVLLGAAFLARALVFGG
jgi:hypothetical protein